MCIAGVSYPFLFRMHLDAVLHNIQPLVLVISAPCHLHDLWEVVPDETFRSWSKCLVKIDSFYMYDQADMVLRCLEHWCMLTALPNALRIPRCGSTPKALPATWFKMNIENNITNVRIDWTSASSNKCRETCSSKDDDCMISAWVRDEHVITWKHMSGQPPGKGPGWSNETPHSPSPLGTTPDTFKGWLESASLLESTHSLRDHGQCTSCISIESLNFLQSLIFFGALYQIVSHLRAMLLEMLKVPRLEKMHAASPWKMRWNNIWEEPSRCYKWEMLASNLRKPGPGATLHCENHTACIMKTS